MFRFIVWFHHFLCLSAEGPQNPAAAPGWGIFAAFRFWLYQPNAA
jgi:hypothetical protein